MFGKYAHYYVCLFVQQSSDIWRMAQCIIAKFGQYEYVGALCYMCVEDHGHWVNILLHIHINWLEIIVGWMFVKSAWYQRAFWSKIRVWGVDLYTIVNVDLCLALMQWYRVQVISLKYVPRYWFKQFTCKLPMYPLISNRLFCVSNSMGGLESVIYWCIVWGEFMPVKFSMILWLKCFRWCYFRQFIVLRLTNNIVYTTVAQW